jgi:hypothetical protein
MRSGCIGNEMKGRMSSGDQMLSHLRMEGAAAVNFPLVTSGKDLRKACKGTERVVMPEMGLGQLAEEVGKYLPAGCTVVQCITSTLSL